MKRIVLLVIAMLLLASGTAEARWFGRSSGGTYTYSAQQAPPNGHSTRSAQGVANIMAALGRVGHWGGNPGYEGCGAGASPAAAYQNCCYANSGMATVDVGYARSASGMWFCCRRYR